MLKSVADVLALLSVAALSIPAWYANRYGYLLIKMKLKSLRLGAPEFQAQYDGLVQELQELRDGWKPWKGWCFYIGTAPGLLAAAILAWTTLHEHPPPSVHT